MARWGVIKSSTVAKYNRLDAGFYLGNDEENTQEIEKARTNLKRAKTKLKNAQQHRANERKRISKMCEAGEVFLQPFPREQNMVPNFDFTNQGRRPSTAQIVSAWKKADRPRHFTVEYGETFAEFQYNGDTGPLRGWLDSGNGCRGVQRDKVVKALNALEPGLKALGVW